MSKRIVLILSSFPKLSETFIVSKFLGLLERGWDVQVMCNESVEAQWSHFPDLTGRSGIRGRVKVGWPHHPQWLAVLLLPLVMLHCFGNNPVGTWRYLRLGAKRLGWDVFRHLYLDAPLVALKPDLIHFEFGALAVDRMYLKELLACKVVVSFRGYDLNFSGLETTGYYDEVWKAADGLHLLGEDLWRRAQRRGCPPGKLRALIPPAICGERFARVKKEATTNQVSGVRPLRILSVGRLEWKKGYEYAIQAVRLLENAGVDCKYRIVGDGNYLEPLAFARHQLGLGRAVEFLGAVAPGEVREQMEEADVFLHAAVSEGFCNAVMEAQAMELPVVCTDADGLGENVADGETGFVVPRRDPEALAEKLITLACDPALRQRMGEAGKRRVRSHFRLEDQIQRFEQLYQAVFSSPA